MDAVEVGNVIQVIAVLTAVGASIVALVVSALDRRNARAIADADRASALKHAHLMFELETLSRLAENLNRGGSVDPQESRRMGAEALTLIGLLGPDRLPDLWPDRIGEDEKLRQHLTDPDLPDWNKRAIQVQLAISRVLADIGEATAEARSIQTGKADRASR